MTLFRRFFPLVLASALVTASFVAPAAANPLDVQLRGLGAYTRNGDQAPRERFRLLTAEIGFALSPRTAAPAQGLGMSGFDVSFDVALVSLNIGSEYWQNGVTEQERRLGTLPGSTQAVTGMHVRKGLPFGLELEAHINWLLNSTMFMIGGDIRYVFLEGYKYLPNFAVRAGVGRLLNAQEIDLTTVNLDMTVSKTFALGGMVRLTPMVGYGILFMNANSAVLDATPDNTTDNIALEQPNGSLYTLPESPLARNFHHRIYAGIELQTFIFVFLYQFDVGLITGGRPLFQNTIRLGLRF